jgi:hypothetical protein
MNAAFRLVIPVAGALLASSAFAQTPLLTTSADMRTHGTTLNLFAGGVTASRDAGAAAGGAIGWELTPRFALEGSGAWLEWGQQSHAFTASLTAHAALLTSRPVVPFLTAGMGVYHASFDRADTGLPGFYRRRMGTAGAGPNRAITFVDPTLVGGGGLEMFVGRHWSVRPEVLANVVMRDSRRFVATTGVVRLAYHFEDHPVTP